jgi:sugar O-acyltransferase (sialic acid O-acetyltransferase NeuD family)
MIKKAFIGNGGHLREVIAHTNYDVIRFVEDEYFKEEYNTLPLSKFNPEEYSIMIAISDSQVRSRIQKSLPKETRYFSFIDPSAILLDENIVIGEGSFIGANCVITTNVKIGDHAILNRNVNIGHDTIIGDCFSAMAGSVVSGDVSIGDQCYMGNNSSIREKITVCDDVTIGMNCAVVKDIDKPGTYVGVPAKKIK